LTLGIRGPAPAILVIACAMVVAGCAGDAARDAVHALDGVAEAQAQGPPGVEESPTSLIPFTHVYEPQPEGAIDPPRGRAGLASLPLDLTELSALLVVPVAGVLRSQLRDSYNEARGSGLHEGMDILVPRGTPVLSAADGRVLKLFDSVPGGLMVYATDSSERFILLYGHLDGYAEGIREGMLLVGGQVIGYVGTTGNAPVDTPHLHFEILRGEPDLAWWKGIPVNPYPLLAP
jgi:peptidoglycan LD-endopeptidase LytH